MSKRMLLLKALLALALAATATAQIVMEADEISRLASEGGLSGAVSLRVVAGLSAKDAEDAVRGVAAAMGVGGNRVTRAFWNAGKKNEAAHRAAGLDEFWTFAATEDGQTYPLADSTTRRLTEGAGDNVANAFAMFQATPTTFSATVVRIEPEGVVKFSGFLPDDADESLILGSCLLYTSDAADE